MDENLNDYFLGVDRTRAEETATMLIERHDLAQFITRWNKGDPDSSLISTLDHLREALDISFRASEKPINVCAPEFEADINFRLCVEVYIECLLMPVIQASFEAGLQRCVIRWARQILRCRELRAQSPAPFQDETEWISWLLHCQFNKKPSGPLSAETLSYLEERAPKLLLCSPAGGSLFPQDVEGVIAVDALLDNMDLARKHGWLAS
jgi:hypothetical protein